MRPLLHLSQMNLMWDIYNSLYGTNRIMPFSSKYSHMGQTERIRIPKNCLSHIENILEHYNRICGTHDEEFLHKVQKNIEIGLGNID